MPDNAENPVALAGADRVDVTVLVGNDDVDLGVATLRERQAGHILTLYAISLPVALLIAEHAFDAGRRRT
jgi:hypothetical protein